MNPRPQQRPRLTDSFGHTVLTFMFLCAINLSTSGQESPGVSAATASDPPAEPLPARIYRSPEERREAGLGRELTEWLTVSGLAEAEAEYNRNAFQGDNPDRSSNDASQTIQLGADVTFSELINAELIFDYELDRGHGELDEWVINFETESWGLSAGRQYVPFGEYYSHFVIGPMLEFGETRADALTIDYSYEGFIDLLAFVFEGDARKADNGGTLDWGIGFEIASQDEALKMGVSYLSDLAETDQMLLEDFNEVYQQRVAGWNAYGLVGFDSFEITAEIVKAIDSFAEFERDENKPWAFNVEFAWFPWSSLQFAVRIESSGELMDEPKRQYGVSLTWRIGKHITLAADYLFGQFKDGFVVDDNDNELNSRHQAAAQLSIEF